MSAPTTQKPVSRRPSKAVDEPIDALPMKKSNPLMVGGIIAAVLLVGGVVVLTGGKKKPPSDAAAAAAAVNTDTMTPEERKRHIEITRKGLEAWGEQQKADEAKKKSEEAAKEEKAKEEKAKEEAAVAAKAGGGTGTGPAPKAPVNNAAAKKQADSLEGMASDIEGKLKK
jgi:hypothetical protein